MSKASKGTRHFLCKSDEIKSGEMRAFQIEGEAIVLCRNGDTYSALQNRCPHHGAELSGGVLGGTNIAACGVGTYKFVRAGEIVRCPRHGFEYGALDGRSLHDPRVRVKTYKVTLSDDDVFVEL